MLDQEFNEGELDWNDPEFDEEESEKSAKSLTRALPEFKEIVILGEEAGFEPQDFEVWPLSLDFTVHDTNMGGSLLNTGESMIFSST